MCQQYLTWCQESGCERTLRHGRKTETTTTILSRIRRSQRVATMEGPLWVLYMNATKKSKEDGSTKVAILLTAMGKDAIAIYKTMTWAEDKDADDLAKVLECIQQLFQTQGRWKIYLSPETPTTWWGFWQLLHGPPPPRRDMRIPPGGKGGRSYVTR